jgi:tetratricopeptide (TPR) repeat protein
MLSNKFNIAFNRLNFEIAKMIFNPDYFPEIPAADNEINRNFTQHIIKTIEQHGWENAKVQYEKREASASLIEYIMRQEGFHYLDNESPDIALQVFEMNVLAYPRSANALQGLGEAYMETGKKELALKYFRESIRINPDNDFVNKMIINLSE